MGWMSDVGDALFGKTKTSQVATLTPDQVAYQNFLSGQAQGLAGQTMDSSYAGGYANQAYGDMQNALRGQMNQALSANRHSSRFHSSGQGYRDANIRNQFSQTMTDLAYKHAMTQQDWMQSYAQKAKDWNYTGKYQAMAMLSDPILKNQFENVTERGTGFMDIFNAVSGMGQTIYSAASGIPTGGGTMKQQNLGGGTRLGGNIGGGR